VLTHAGTGFVVKCDDIVEIDLEDHN